MLGRSVVVTFVVLILVGGGAVAAARPIAIVINGSTLPLQPPPRLENGVLFVPVRRTIEALGLPFDRAGRRIVTQIGSKTVTLTIDSRVAQVDGASLTLDQPTLEIKNVLYAPLRFFTDVLGAQASFDRRTNSVRIVAQLVGRSEVGMIASGKGFERLGTVVAVDVLSDPPTLTLGSNAAVKTIPIARNAVVEMQDVNANVTTPGELADIRPGDFSRVMMRKTGRVDRVVDEFGTRQGRVVAVAGNQFVTSTGAVIEAGRSTEVALNGKAAGFGDLRPGDRVTIRYNVETNEVREVLASRRVALPPTAPGGVSISGVEANATQPLRPGAVVRGTLRGTRDGAATFALGSYVTDQAMHETSPGVYAGSYTIPRGANFDSVPVIGTLSVGGSPGVDVTAPETISASSTPPGIGDFAPSSGATVNARRPAIYATFTVDAVPVNASSAVMWVNGRDVTSNCVRTAQFIQYFPSYSYRNGVVRVRVQVADQAGNTATKSWSFTIHSR